MGDRLDRVLLGGLNALTSGFFFAARAVTLFPPKDMLSDFNTEPEAPVTSEKFKAATRRARPATEPRELTRDEVNRDFLLRQQWDRRMDNKGRVLWVLHPNAEDAVNSGRIREVMDVIMDGQNEVVSTEGIVGYGEAKKLGLAHHYGRKHVFGVQYGSPFGKQIERSMRPRGHGYHVTLEA